MEQQYVTHTLGQGENLFLLAELYYGNAGLWWVIYHANLEAIGDDPEGIDTGIVLRIPLVETKRQRIDMPSFIPATPFVHSEDPLIQLARERYVDIALYFDVLEASELDGDEVLAVTDKVVIPPRGNPYDLKKAEFYRAKFYEARER